MQGAGPAWGYVASLHHVSMLLCLVTLAQFPQLALRAPVLLHAN